MAKALTKTESKSVRRYGPYVPRSFPKWNRAVDGLEDAGAWSCAFERARLPKELVVPRAGEIWEAVRDCEVNFRIHHTEPYGPKLFKSVASMTAPAAAHILLFGGKAQLGRGERIQIVAVDDPKKPLSVTFVPVRYQELEEGIVPEEMRKTPAFGGYELSVRTARTIAHIPKQDSETYFIEAFKLVRKADAFA
jgi:hypothetical protein